jgi:hypothetical protein
MPLSCPDGWTSHTMPATPAGSSQLNAGDTYTRVSYEWELADNSTPLTCACGQTATFNFGYGYNDQGNITVEPLGVGGGVSAGTTGYTELGINVGGDGFEYIGYKIVLKETTETGTVTKSGGFAGDGFIEKVTAFFRVLRYGVGALLPTIIYNAPSSTTVKYTLAGWKTCRRACG